MCGKDFLLIFPTLIEYPPWTKRKASVSYLNVSTLSTRNILKGEWRKFVDLKWSTVDRENLLLLTKTEAQVKENG